MGRNVKISAKKLSQWVISQRLGKNMSQTELIRKLEGKISARRIIDIEKGRIGGSIREENLFFLSEIFETTLENVLEIIEIKSENYNTPKVKQLYNNLSFIHRAPYTVQQASKPDIKWIAENNKKVYEGIDAIPEDKMLEWFNANPNGFNIIKDNKGQICGNIDILPLTQNSLDEFISGKIIELDFSFKSIVQQSQRDEIKNLYIESLVLNGPFGNPFALAEILNNIDSITNRIAESTNINKIYAVSASDLGSMIMRHLGFYELGTSSKRLDNHNLFFIDFQQLNRNVKKIINKN